MDVLELIVLALATWRVAIMFVRETGPFFIFKRIREAVGITHDQDGAILQIPDTLFAGLLSCMWCASVWVAAIWMVFWYFFPEPTSLVAVVFCLSAVAILLDRLFDGRKSP